MSDKKAEAKPEGAAAAAPAEGGGGGGLKSWLPLVVTILLMPALAFVTTKFLIVPKVLHARGGEAEPEETTEEGGDAHGAKPDAKHGEDKADKGHGEAKKPEKAEHGEKGKGGGKGKKQTAQLSKMIVNVAGTAGTRYLMSSITIVGTHADLKGLIEENKDQLLDLANSALASKTIADLEKPGSRNQLRSELMSIFNNALGGTIVQEIYFTEFAIQ